MTIQDYTLHPFMSIIAEFTVPADQFALYETLSNIPEMIVEVERVVAHDPDQIMPYFWTAGGSHEEFEAAVKDDPSIENLEQLDETEDAVLYRANWIQDVESVIYAYTEIEARLLNATGRNDQWELQLRFDDEEGVTQFNDYIKQNEFKIDLHRLYEPTHPSSEGNLGLTDTQRETVLAGLRAGYYEIPRGMKPAKLAEEFGISQQALSKRFRRAHRALAENALTVTPPDDE
jgi:predicted DNA binding protein